MHIFTQTHTLTNAGTHIPTHNPPPFFLSNTHTHTISQMAQSSAESEASLKCYRPPRHWHFVLI